MSDSRHLTRWHSALAIALSLSVRIWRATFSVVIVLGLAACSAEVDQAAGPSSQPLSCADLAAFDLPGTTIESAIVVAAGELELPPPPFGQYPDRSNLPEFCRVSGVLSPTADSVIRFELWLPEEGWNGRFMQTGNGGAAGSIIYAGMIYALQRGYAVTNTDTGHEGGGFTWALGHPEKLVDFQYRAVHELTLAGKAVTQTHYGTPPESSFFAGCSLGGRQGLLEAQRFPGDYDAIIAGAPASNWSVHRIYDMLKKAQMGPEGLPVNKLAVLNEAALAACDTEDGVEDRVISLPQQCDFDPASALCTGTGEEDCLTVSEVAAAKRIYAGVVSDEGEVLYPGTGPGSEYAWAVVASPDFDMGTSYFRNVVKKDPDWDPATLDVETDLALAEELDQGGAKAMDPDLSAFFSSGGKLLLYHGTTDGRVPYGNSVNYYEDVIATLGRDAVNEHMRFYLSPGMDHCAGGNGAYQVDGLSAMEDWVERDVPPDVLNGIHPSGSPDDTAFERPICPYPQITTYKGTGDPTLAENFFCQDN